MIYFDNAATTNKKPDSVTRALSDSVKRFSANPGRSSHKLSVKASEIVYDTREALARHFHTYTPENIVFTYNATYALNMAIKTLVPKNSHVIISDLEHNSVVRPLMRLCDEYGIEVSVFKTDVNNVYFEIESHIKENTSAIISTLSSNVIGRRIPLFLLSEIKKKHGLITILDASQEAGHNEINLGDVEFDAFVAPAHKALMGVMGLGICIFSKKPDHTFVEGGSGSESRSGYMPKELPEMQEAGTVALPAIMALGEAVRFIDRVGVSSIADRINYLTDYTSSLLDEISGVVQYGHDNGVLSFNIGNMPCEYVASNLDKMGIYVRAGLHCAPLAHKTLGTLDIGTVRVSFSYFNTVSEIKKFVKALKKIR